MPGIGDLFKSDGMLFQLFVYNVLGSMLQPLLAPASQELADFAFDVLANTPMSPADAASTVAAQFADPGWGQAEAQHSGVNADRFAHYLALAQTKIDPAQAATAAVAQFMSAGDALAEAQANGMTPERFAVLLKLATTRLDPAQAAAAAVAGFITPGDATAEAQATGMDAGRFATMLDLARTYLSPADAATAVIRGFLPQDQAAAEAAHTGMDAARFQTMIDLSGEAPAPGDLATAARRGIIPESGQGADSVSFEQGIREGNLKDKWSPIMRELAIQWPSPTDALNALLEGQITASEAQTLYQKFGGDPQYFQMLFNTAGTAPTPTQALELANRGIIPWDGTGPKSVSYHQAFLEGPWRNKWEPVFRALGEYLPPPRTVTAMFHDGQLSHDQAAQLLTKQGLTPDLVAAYLAPHGTSTAAAQRDLTRSDILALYSDRLTSRADTLKSLESIGYSAANAALIVELTDVRTSASQISVAVSRVRELFLAGKLSTADARAELVSLGVPTAQVGQIIDTWGLVGAASVKLLTAAQTVDAWYLTLISTDDAMSRLESLGYDTEDAGLLLAIKNKGPVPGLGQATVPPPGPPAVGGT